MSSFTPNKGPNSSSTAPIWPSSNHFSEILLKLIKKVDATILKKSKYVSIYLKQGPLLESYRTICPKVNLICIMINYSVNKLKDLKVFLNKH